MPGLQARCPVQGMQEATTHRCFSPSPSPPLSLKISKYFFKKTVLWVPFKNCWFFVCVDNTVMWYNLQRHSVKEVIRPLGTNHCWGSVNYPRSTLYNQAYIFIGMIAWYVHFPAPCLCHLIYVGGHSPWRHAELMLLIWAIFLKRFYVFLERGREGGRQGEKHWHAWGTSISCLPHTPNQGPGCNPGMFPDGESNWQPFDLRDNTQPTELHQSGLEPLF